MGTRSEGRLTPSSQYLLAQLAAPDALIVFATTCEEGDPRFYFQQSLAHRIVPERSVDVLVSKVCGQKKRCIESINIPKRIATSKKSRTADRQFVMLYRVHHSHS